jgi:hypothetical protein
VRPLSFKSRTSCSDAPEGVQAPAFETVDAAVSQGQHEVLAVPQPVASDVNQPGMLVCCKKATSGSTNIMQLCHVCCCSGSAFHPLTLHACGWFSSTRLCVSNFLQASTLVDQLPSPASLCTTESSCALSSCSISEYVEQQSIRCGAMTLRCRATFFCQQLALGVANKI